MFTQYTVESYSGTYKLIYLSNGWRTLYFKGKAIGSTKIKGGVYAAANYFKV